ncbi:MAG: bile acid:sodium symporter family protein [Anaerococcus sp.]|nr:bile acid transporter [Anaerococcus hydrogenalis]MDU2829446.1 bile acid:sodium symporter family protein [Anaerococcus sp.]
MEKFSRISDKITQNIGLIIVIFSVVAYFVPDYFSWMTNYTTIFLALAMFGMGTSIESDAFKKILKNPRDIFIGALAQFTIMPLLAWILAVGFDVNRDIALGIILVGACPGGTASNVITHIAGGNVSMSVSMTILSTLLAPIVTPFLVYLLAGRWVEVSILAMFKSVVTVVLIPVLMGIFAKKLSPEKMEKSKSIFPLISSLAIILIISGIIGANSEKIAKSGLIVLLIVMIHNALGLLLGLGVSKLFKMDYDKQTALSIEVGMQNSGLAIQLATANFALNPLATLPGAIFSIWHNISGSIFASIRRKDVKEIALAREK